MLALGGDEGFPQFSAGSNVTTSKGLTDVLLLNGGFRPVIAVAPRIWQRWRIINTSVRYILQLAILDGYKENAAKPAPCEVMVVSKDGVMMMEVRWRGCGWAVGGGLWFSRARGEGGWQRGLGARGMLLGALKSAIDISSPDSST